VRDSLYAPPSSLATDGAQLDRYQENQVVLFMHEMVWVAGRTIKIWHAGKKIMARAEFDVGDELGAWLFGKIQRGFIRMASVGFRKLQWYDVEEGAKDQATKLAGPVRRVTSWELLEWSVVSIGANPEALGRSFARVTGANPLAAQRAFQQPQGGGSFHLPVSTRSDDFRLSPSRGFHLPVRN